jgi:uncharacterized damage-inducible protein DinB
MKTKDAIKGFLTSTRDLLPMYLADLSDADLLVRPVPGANHMAWQLGHLINSEKDLVKAAVAQAAMPDIPAAVAEKDNKAAASHDTGFRTKEEYLGLFTKVRNASIAAVDNLSDADFDKATTGDMAQWAPTVAAVFTLIANHTMMHAGQFTVVRRKLGKPIIF